MKKTLIIAALAVCSIAYAAPTSLIGNLVTVNGTTNSTVLTMPEQNINFQQFNFEHGGLLNTNQVTLAIQISTDLTNYTTVSTYKFSNTNAGTYTYYAPSTNVPIYLRVRVTTTNSTGLGGTYGN